MTPAFDSQTLGRRVNELLILVELRRKPKHGYQIALEIEERSGGYFPFNHGTLYPILHRLENEGLIAGDWSSPEEGRARKRYALTEAGRTYLRGAIDEWNRLHEQLEPFLHASTSADAEVRARTA
jgi:PadR family transcriptional regulator, regulatory protein PadR